MHKLLLGVVLLAATIAQPAEAAWQKVSTKHFIIYADDDPQKLTAFATRLEKFDRAVRLARKMNDDNVGDGNRLTVYVVQDMEQVGKLIRNQSAGGFYIGRVSGPLAVVPKDGGSTWEIEFTAETMPGTIEVTRPVAPGAGLVRADEDAAAGDVLVRAGLPVRAPQLGFLAAAGVGSKKVPIPS